jgi:HPt (histidine-containing phosphotransfer) domain-containing protein
MTPQERMVVHVDAEIAELIPRFLANQQQALATMQEALRQADYAALGSLGHKMKGAAGGYGFDAMTAIGGAIEHAAKVGQHAEISACLASLECYLEHVEIVYDA